MRIRQFLGRNAPAATVLIRLLVGWVFMSEGIQKFLFPDALGVGRFGKIGIPAPEFFAPFVGVLEIVCGAVLIVGQAGGPPFLNALFFLSHSETRVPHPCAFCKGGPRCG